MRSRAWAWLLALVALVLAVIPMAAMAGMFGLRPMSLAVANSLWLAAIVLTIVVVRDVDPAGAADARVDATTPFFSVACISTRPSAAAAFGSNCDPLHRSISRTAISAGIAGRCVCGCVIES